MYGLDGSGMNPQPRDCGGSPVRLCGLFGSDTAYSPFACRPPRSISGAHDLDGWLCARPAMPRAPSFPKRHAFGVEPFGKIWPLVNRRHAKTVVSANALRSSSGRHRYTCDGPSSVAFDGGLTDTARYLNSPPGPSSSEYGCQSRRYAPLNVHVLASYAPSAHSSVPASSRP